MAAAEHKFRLAEQLLAFEGLHGYSQMRFFSLLHFINLQELILANEFTPVNIKEPPMQKSIFISILLFSVMSCENTDKNQHDSNSFTDTTQTINDTALNEVKANSFEQTVHIFFIMSNYTPLTQAALHKQEP